MSSYEIDELITAAILVAPFLICALWLGSVARCEGGRVMANPCQPEMKNPPLVALAGPAGSYEIARK